MGKGRDRRKRSAKRQAQAHTPKLEALPDDPTGSDDWDAFVGAPVKPKPHRSSGAVALREPEEPEVVERAVSRDAG